MLRIVSQNSAAGAKSYYSKADYYAEGQELAGEWGGRGSTLLGLEGQVGQHEFDLLCDNRDPRSGEPLTPRTRQDRRVLYDWNFHVPKSVSLAFELSGDNRILQVFRKAVAETMKDAETDMKTRVRQNGRDEDRVTGNMTYATFIHRTSRPSKLDKLPDPHLHAHCVVFNTTWDNQESRWKAGQFGDLIRDAPYHQAAFHARLAQGLAGLGYGIHRKAKGWELAGVTPGLVKKFSRRTSEIDALAEAQGITDPKAKDKLGAKSRANKVAMSIVGLKEYWLGRVSDHERIALDSLLKTPKAQPIGLTAKAAVLHAAKHHFERTSAISEKRFLADALMAGLGSVDVESVQREAKRNGLLTALIDGVNYITSRDVLAEEKQLLHFARSTRATRKPIVPKHTFVRDWLNDGQKSAVQQLLRSKDNVMLVRGAAGTGKTTMMQEAVEAMEAAGQAVTVLAPSADASRGVLRTEGFETADTVASFLLKPELQEAARDGVIWVDEAGLLGLRDLAKLARIAEDVDARIILQGDTKQHASVVRGSALKLLESHAGLPVAEVTAIQRQSGEYREAVKDLAAGRTGEGFQKLEALGWVKEVAGPERSSIIARDYLDVLGSGHSALIVAPTHAEGETITEAVRGLLKTRSLLGVEQTFTRLRPLHLTEAERSEAAQYEPGDVLQYHRSAPGHRPGSRLTVREGTPLPLDQAERFQAYRPEDVTFAVGDKVRVTAGGKTLDREHSLNTGAVFTVKAFTREGNIVTDSGWVVGKDFGHLSHGYAVTSHASQGRTVDHVLIAQGSESFAASSKEQFYVSTSRGRKSATIYTDNAAELRERIERGDERVSATDLFAKSRLQRRAKDRLLRTTLAARRNWEQAQPTLNHETERVAQR